MAVRYCLVERLISCKKKKKNQKEKTKTYLRCTIGKNQLNTLTFLYIESELVSAIDFQDTIETFDNLKIQMK